MINPENYEFEWDYKKEIQYPCADCHKKIIGKPTTVDRELKSAEFWKLSGKIIKRKDWEYWKERRE